MPFVNILSQDISSDSIDTLPFFDTDKKQSKRRGKPVTCRQCKHRFYVLQADNKAAWMKAKLPCPSCKTIYSCLPLQEKQLRILQDSYFDSNRDSFYLGEMYKILYPYTKSLVFKHYGRIMDDEEQDEFTTTAVYLLINSYYKFESFRIDLSFGGYLKCRFLQIPFTATTDADSFDDITNNSLNEYSSRTTKQYDLNEPDEDTILFNLSHNIKNKIQNDRVNNNFNLDRLLLINDFLVSKETSYKKYGRSLKGMNKKLFTNSMILFKNHIKNND
jgi:hypothetical protein